MERESDEEVSKSDDAQIENTEDPDMAYFIDLKIAIQESIEQKKIDDEKREMEIRQQSLMQSDIVNKNPIEVLKEQTKDTPNNPVSFGQMLEMHIRKSMDTPIKRTDNETKAANSNSPLEETDKKSGSKRKGKEALNPKYRYTKRSKTNVSSSNSLVDESPVKNFKDLSSAESKTLQSPKAEFQKISSPQKRKVSDLRDKELDDERQPYESRARPSVISMPSGKFGDVEVAKKLKFEVDENSRKSPTSATTLPQIYHENTGLAQFMDPPQTDHSYNISKQLDSPSSEGLKTLISPISSNEESSQSSHSDSLSIGSEAVITDTSDKRWQEMMVTIDSCFMRAFEEKERAILKDDEKTSMQFPTITKLLTQKEYKKKYLEEMRNQPSTSGLSNVGGCISTLPGGIDEACRLWLEKDSSTNVSAIEPSEREDSSPSSVSSIEPSERDDWFPKNVTEDSSSSGFEES